MVMSYNTPVRRINMSIVISIDWNYLPTDTDIMICLHCDVITCLRSCLYAITVGQRVDVSAFSKFCFMWYYHLYAGCSNEWVHADQDKTGDWSIIESTNIQLTSIVIYIKMSKRRLCYYGDIIFFNVERLDGCSSNLVASFWDLYTQFFINGCSLLWVEAARSLIEKKSKWLHLLMSHDLLEEKI